MVFIYCVCAWFMRMDTGGGTRTRVHTRVIMQHVRVYVIFRVIRLDFLVRKIFESAGADTFSSST